MAQKTIEQLQDLVAKNYALTPMMEQYLQLLKEVPDNYVFFRMGDFYELFFQDAIDVSQLLNITLTHRGKMRGLKNEAECEEIPIPMAGIPFHAAAQYCDRLTARGFKIAICEQIEDPELATGIVKRAVTQIVGPGIPFDLDKCQAKESHLILCAQLNQNCLKKNLVSFVFVDFTTGNLSGNVLPFEDFLTELELLRPKEILTYFGQWKDFPEFAKTIEYHQILTTQLREEYFTAKNTAYYIEQVLPHFRSDKILKLNSAILNPIGATLYYLCSTQGKDALAHLGQFKFELGKGRMRVSTTTLQGLEILPQNPTAHTQSSLIEFFDHTQTSLGGRKLKSFFIHPLTQLKEIKERQKKIEFYITHEEARKKVRQQLQNVRDIERILAKFAARKIRPQDLLNLAKTIQIGEQLGLSPDPKITHYSEEILKTFSDEVGADYLHGNLLRPGLFPQRDHLASLQKDGAKVIADLVEKYQGILGSNKLRIKQNNIFGYFIEVTKAQGQNVPKIFKRKQTLVNCERFTTDELEKLEKDILHSEVQLQSFERSIFEDFINRIALLSKDIHLLADSIADLDIYSTFAHICHREGYTKPIFQEQKTFDVQGMWHPLLNSFHSTIVSHDLLLDEEQSFALITGPNMAGKTTVMREVALVQLLAQIGCFVPCKSAILSICDALFSRLGASDNILKGQSTFMVEMVETAEILRHATNHSLVLLDEVGRGTSTYDGLSIAWALVEHLAEKVTPLTLFATHYHELADLVEDLPHAKNMTMEILVQTGEVRFLYNLINGSSKKSYGHYVAKCAGIPQVMLKRAKVVLHDLESHHQMNRAPKFEEQLNFSNF